MIQYNRPCELGQPCEGQGLRGRRCSAVRGQRRCGGGRGGGGASLLLRRHPCRVRGQRAGDRPCGAVRHGPSTVCLFVAVFVCGIYDVLMLYPIWCLVPAYRIVHPVIRSTYVSIGQGHKRCVHRFFWSCKRNQVLCIVSSVFRSIDRWLDCTFVYAVISVCGASHTSWPGRAENSELKRSAAPSLLG